MQKSLIVAVLLAIGNSQQDLVSDAWAGATQVAPAAPPKPTLQLVNSSPAVANNVIRVTEGNQVSLCIVASDPNGYNKYVSFSQASESPTLNSGNAFFADNNCNLGNGSIGKKFTWNTQLGDADQTPNVRLTFTAINTYYTPTLTKKGYIDILVQGSQALNLEALAPNQTLTVGTLYTLPIVASGASNSSAIIITAPAHTNSLPSGAKLSKASLANEGSNKGKWVSTFSWKPTAAQYKKMLLANNNSSAMHTVSFIAEYKTPVSPEQAQTIQTDVNFTVVPPVIDDSSIKNLLVSKAVWNAASKKLSVTGSVKFNSKMAMVANLGVELLNATSGEIITASPIKVLDNGQWSYAQNLTSPPCGLTAKIVYIQTDGSLAESTTATATMTKAVAKASSANCI